MLAWWIHDLSPFAVRFTETLGIRWYGLAYLTGFAIAWWLLTIYEKKGRSPLDAEARSTLMTALIVGTLVGGRLGYVILYRPDLFTLFTTDPPFWGLIAVTEGGMASHGGIVGITLAIGWFSRWTQRRSNTPQSIDDASPPKAASSFWNTADIIASTAAAGVIFGRLANFINGELPGRVTDASWAVLFPTAETVSSEPMVFVEQWGYFGNPRHPSQLYAMALEGIVLFTIMQLRFWKSDVVRRHPGQLSGECLIAYAILRTLSEIYREPDAELILGLSRGTFYSLFMIIAGLGVILHARLRKPAAG